MRKSLSGVVMDAAVYLGVIGVVVWGIESFRQASPLLPGPEHGLFLINPAPMIGPSMIVFAVLVAAGRWSLRSARTSAEQRARVVLTVVFFVFAPLLIGTETWLDARRAELQAMEEVLDQPRQPIVARPGPPVE